MEPTIETFKSEGADSSSLPRPQRPASLRQEHNQTMISESWFAIDFRRFAASQ